MTNQEIQQQEKAETELKRISYDLDDNGKFNIPEYKVSIVPSNSEKSNQEIKIKKLSKLEDFCLGGAVLGTIAYITGEAVNQDVLSLIGPVTYLASFIGWNYSSSKKKQYQPDDDKPTKLK